jgi:DNA invertase Pin-like site-specific DNA recombinase
MNIAYVRGISKDQNISRQLDAFKSYKIDRIRVYPEKTSGNDINKPALEEMLNCLRQGDTVYIESFLTLAHNLFELLEIIHALSQKNVGFVSIKEKIDTTTPPGRQQLHVFSVVYQFARECAKERQPETITEHKPSGRPKRFSIDDNFKAVYQEWKSGNITAVKAMELTNIKKVTFYKLVKEYEAQQRKQVEI